MKVRDIAQKIGATVKGDADLEITGVCSIDAPGEGCITFLESRKHLGALLSGNASAVFTREELDTGKAQILTPAPKLAFAKLLAEFHPPRHPAAGIDARASVAENAVIGKGVTLSPYVSVAEGAVIGDGCVLYPGVVVGERCRIGRDCVLFPNAVLYSDTVLGDRVILHAGAVIGADGFGYTLDEKGRHFKIRQIGNVVIENDVEVGANTCIDRAAMGETRVKQGTKIDNLVQIAHNCQIGEHSILVSQSGISGSCTLGRYVILAGQAGLADHVTLGDKVTLAAQSGTFRDVESGQVYGGSPSIPLGTWKKYVTLLPKLPDYVQKIRELEKRLAAIENEKPNV